MDTYYSAVNFLLCLPGRADQRCWPQEGLSLFFFTSFFTWRVATPVSPTRRDISFHLPQGLCFFTLTFSSVRKKPREVWYATVFFLPRCWFPSGYVSSQMQNNVLQNGLLSNASFHQFSGHGCRGKWVIPTWDINPCAKKIASCWCFWLSLILSSPKVVEEAVTRPL